jgi:putative ABC transport system permease protein
MNRIVGILFQSTRAIVAFKLRTVFCLISVAMGIASITIIVAATEGAYQKAFEMVERFGPDAIHGYRRHGRGESHRESGKDPYAG